MGAARPTQSRAYDAFLRGEQLIITEGKTDIVQLGSRARPTEAVQREPRLCPRVGPARASEALRYNIGDQADSVRQGAHGAPTARSRSPRTGPESH